MREALSKIAEKEALLQEIALDGRFTSKTLTAEKQSGGTVKVCPAACVLRVCLIDKLEIINQT